MSEYTQDQRKGQVTTPLGKDVLLLRGFSGTDTLSRLFSFGVELAASKGTKVPFEKLLGQPMTVHLEVGGELGGGDPPVHHYNGLCVRFLESGQDDVFAYYRADLAPRLWLLTQRARSQIFQHKPVDEIVGIVLKEYAIEHDFPAGLSLPVRDFTVQYRETDFNFISRLMEEEGLFYYFSHSDGRHKMIIGNSEADHLDLPIANSFIYEELGGGARDEDRVTAWEKAQEIRPGLLTLGDYCFTKPYEILYGDSQAQEQTHVGAVAHVLKVADSPKLEIYDFPGEFAERFDEEDVNTVIADARRSADIRMDEETARAVTLRGASNVKHMMAGHRMKLERHPSGNGSYVIASVSHWARFAGDYRSAGGGGATYSNQFTCIPADVPFRPQRLTPKPVVPGCQTATVVGPPGEEIYCDKYGRVKVQFHWERNGKRNESSSCWIRVGTIWAGQQMGAIHLPRIGQEVIVDFLEGDPDEPIIVGSVYNSANMPPYELPGMKSQSGIKSRSTLKGGREDFNELRFEDKKGKEEIYFHAQKDFTRIVEHDDDLEVGNDQTILIKRDRKEQVDRNEEVLVRKNRDHHIEGNDGLWVDGANGRAIRIKKGKQILTIDLGDNLVEVKTGNMKTTLDMGNNTIELKMGDMKTTLDMGNHETRAKLGNISTKADLGKIDEQALQGIEMKVGASSVKVDQVGVTIKGMMVKIEGQIMTDVKGMMTKVDGSAMLKAGGGITMIG